MTTCSIIGKPPAIELGDASRNLRNEPASGLGQPDAPMSQLKQEDAERFLQRLDAGADAGLRRAENICGVMEVQMLSDGEHLDQRNERYPPARYSMSTDNTP